MPSADDFSLPAWAYTDPEFLTLERERIFRPSWQVICHLSEIPNPGDYQCFDFIGEMLFALRGNDGVVRVFHNVCRHRAARLLDGPRGSCTRRIICPYHAWSYDFDGMLKNAPFTDELEDFEQGCFGLKSVRLAVVEGLVLIDLSGEAPSPAEHVGGLAEHLAHYRTGELRRVERVTYEVEANWKAIAENYSECLHCPGVHPELNRLSHYLSGDTLTGPGAWCGGSMVLADGADTMAKNGGAAHRPAIAGLSEDDQRAVLYFLLFPNTLVSLHPDYVMLHTLWPRATDRTEVICEWFFEPATADAPGFDGSDAVAFWDQVNREDWHVCRLAQLGMSSRHYQPGRYTTQEDDVHEFDVMVADRYLEALATPAEVTP